MKKIIGLAVITVLIAGSRALYHGRSVEPFLSPEEKQTLRDAPRHHFTPEELARFQAEEQEAKRLVDKLYSVMANNFKSVLDVELYLDEGQDHCRLAINEQGLKIECGDIERRGYRESELKVKMTETISSDLLKKEGLAVANEPGCTLWKVIPVKCWFLVDVDRLNSPPANEEPQVTLAAAKIQEDTLERAFEMLVERDRKFLQQTRYLKEKGISAEKLENLRKQVQSSAQPPDWGDGR